MILMAIEYAKNRLPFTFLYSTRVWLESEIEERYISSLNSPGLMKMFQEVILKQTQENIKKTKYIMIIEKERNDMTKVIQLTQI